MSEARHARGFFALELAPVVREGSTKHGAVCDSTYDTGLIHDPRLDVPAVLRSLEVLTPPIGSIGQIRQCGACRGWLCPNPGEGRGAPCSRSCIANESQGCGTHVSAPERKSPPLRMSFPVMENYNSAWRGADTAPTFPHERATIGPGTARRAAPTRPACTPNADVAAYVPSSSSLIRNWGPTVAQNAPRGWGYGVWPYLSCSFNDPVEVARRNTRNYLGKILSTTAWLRRMAQ